MINLKIDDLKISSVFVTKASIVVRGSLVHKRDNTRVRKDHDVGRPIRRGCVSVLCRDIDELEWGV